jgi:hypothetical protein
MADNAQAAARPATVEIFRLYSQAIAAKACHDAIFSRADLRVPQTCRQPGIKAC